MKKTLERCLNISGVLDSYLSNNYIQPLLTEIQSHNFNLNECVYISQATQKNIHLAIYGGIVDLNNQHKLEMSDAEMGAWAFLYNNLLAPNSDNSCAMFNLYFNFDCLTLRSLYSICGECLISETYDNPPTLASLTTRLCAIMDTFDKITVLPISHHKRKVIIDCLPAEVLPYVLVESARKAFVVKAHKRNRLEDLGTDYLTTLAQEVSQILVAPRIKRSVCSEHPNGSFMMYIMLHHQAALSDLDKPIAVLNESFEFDSACYSSFVLGSINRNYIAKFREPQHLNSYMKHPIGFYAMAFTLSVFSSKTTFKRSLMAVGDDLPTYTSNTSFMPWYSSEEYLDGATHFAQSLIDYYKNGYAVDSCSSAHCKQEYISDFVATELYLIKKFTNLPFKESFDENVLTQRLVKQSVL